MARAESQVLGIDTLPLIAIPHPLAGNANDLVLAKAAAIANEVELALTESAQLLSERYKTKFLQLTERRLDRGALCIDEACAIDLATPQTVQAETIARPTGSRP